MAHGDKNPSASSRGNAQKQESARVEPTRYELGLEAEVLAAALPIEQYLAAILAHELSNPFTALSGRVDLMRVRKDLPAALVRDLDAMKSANDRIDRILTNLKGFSRRETPAARPMEIYPVLQSAVERFRETPRGQRVEVTVHAQDTAVRAVMDPHLLAISIAAIIESLTGRSRHIKSMSIHIVTDPANEEATLVFTDQGPHISEEDMARVFHPFGGSQLPSWPSVITLAYTYYVTRAWGGTFRFRTDGKDMITELCLVHHA